MSAARDPYYADDFVMLHHGDCLAVLPTLDPVDCVITDPPYNVGLDYGAATDDLRGDYDAWCSAWYAETRRLAPLVALTPGIANVGRWVRIAGDPAWIIAWHKPSAMSRAPMGFNNWEPVLVYGDLPKHKSVDVFTAPIIPSDRLGDHPCPKPEKWGSALVARLTEPGQTVLDPFAGTGTVLLAAKAANVYAVGVEIEQRYCDTAVRRLAQEVLDLASA